MLSRVCKSIGVGLGTLALAACASPLARTAEQEMHDQLLAAHRAYVVKTAAGPVIELQRAASELDKELSPQRQQELDRISGAASYENKAFSLGRDLAGQTEVKTYALSLQQAVTLAVKHAIDIQQARLVPAIAQTQITQAEGAFDAVWFTNVSYSDLDTPKPPSLTPTLGDTQSQTLTVTTGIRKPLTTGGTFTAQTVFDRLAQIPSSYSATGTGPYTYYDASVQVGIVQPLLRGFGEDVTRAQVVLAQSAREQGMQDLKASLLTILANVETSYWNLYFTRQRLLIQERLLERTIDDYNRIRQRKDFDVSPVRQTEAGSFVELRRAEVIRARQDVRNASDTLKRLLNAPDLPLTDETLLVPTDAPADTPITFSITDAVATALRSRPEMRKSLLQIKDASVRQRVADNARLPLFNLTAQIRYNGMDPNAIDQAYGKLTDGNYIDYLISGQFEVPIGNRAAEGLYNQRALERQAAAVAYQKAAQDVVLEVKQAMRSLITAYELIGAAKAARRAAADNLRAIERQEDAGVELTPEFLLDLKLNSQQRLADAETQEVQALAGYNASVAAFYRAVGTLLERNGVDFKDEP